MESKCRQMLPRLNLILISHQQLLTYSHQDDKLHQYCLLVYYLHTNIYEKFLCYYMVFTNTEDPLIVFLFRSINDAINMEVVAQRVFNFKHFLLLHFATKSWCSSVLTINPNLPIRSIDIDKLPFHLYRPQRSCDKVMFLPLSVILFRWGGLCPA